MGARGYKTRLRRSKVKSIEEVAVLIALDRPGRLDIREEYMRRKAGQKPVLYEDPLLEPILSGDLRLIVYDEQFDRILVALAGDPCADVGYSLAEADNARRVLAEKMTMMSLNRCAGS